MLDKKWCLENEKNGRLVEVLLLVSMKVGIWKSEEKGIKISRLFEPLVV